MTADEIIQRFDELQTNTYPPTGQPVTMNGDAWAGQLVVRVQDLLHLMFWLLERVENRRGA